MQERVFHMKSDAVEEKIPLLAPIVAPVVMSAPEPTPLEQDENYIMPKDVLYGFLRVLAIAIGLVVVYFAAIAVLEWQGIDMRAIIIESGFGILLK